MNSVVIEGLAGLRLWADRWNDLWERSEFRLPTMRAECMALWLETFAAGADFRIFAIEEGGRLVAALPLVGRKLKGIVPVAGLPCGPWGQCGDLLCDPTGNSSAAFDRLLATMRTRGAKLGWFEPVRIESATWRTFREAAQRSGWRVAVREQYRLGLVDVDHTWDEYQARWSRNHRRAMRRAADRAAQEGGVELRVLVPQSQEELMESIRKGFAVEDRGWKGAEGTSVVRSPGILAYYERQAAELFAAGRLELVFLWRGDEPIAFEYAPIGKQTYFACKVGYDESRAALSPGQFLRYLYFERVFRERRFSTIDFAGVLTEATAKWSTRSEAMGRVLVAAPGITGRILFQAHENWQPRWKAWKARKRNEPLEPPLVEIGAAPRESKRPRDDENKRRKSTDEGASPSRTEALSALET